MANITGVVEIFMTNKFNSENYAMKLEGDDTWYNQKKEWLDEGGVIPRRGDTVSFSGGKTGKYIQYLEVLSSAAPEAKAAPAAKSGGGYNALGVELGHAANNAVQLCIARGDLELDAVHRTTKEFYNMMKMLRDEYEGTEVVSEEAPKASAKPKAKPKAKPIVEDDPDDDIPF